MQPLPVSSLCFFSGVSTVGHGLARDHPTSARVGREICTNSKSFLDEWSGGSSLRMSLKVHRISSMNRSRKCVCPLQIVYAYLAFGGFTLRPAIGTLPLNPSGRLPSLSPPVSTLPPNPGYATAFLLLQNRAEKLRKQERCNRWTGGEHVHPTFFPWFFRD